MRPDRVEVTPPAFDDDLSLAQRVEDFTVEQFIAKACVEALDVPVLPRAAWRDVDGLCPDRCDPLRACFVGSKSFAPFGTSGSSATSKEPTGYLKFLAVRPICKKFIWAGDRGTSYPHRNRTHVWDRRPQNTVDRRENCLLNYLTSGSCAALAPNSFAPHSLPGIHRTGT